MSGANGCVTRLGIQLSGQWCEAALGLAQDFEKRGDLFQTSEMYAIAERESRRAFKLAASLNASHAPLGPALAVSHTCERLGQGASFGGRHG